MKKTLNITFESSLSKLCEVNSSFDSGILKVCYTGENRNKSYFSKESIQKSLKTIYNCPVVCNYNREDGTLGGHDIELARDYNGDLSIVNLTHPVGVIPESANIWFENFEEEDGTEHEYLCAEVLIWKRQEAYKKIKEDGITAHSMEITVKEGFEDNGIYHIEDFEFTAFALIGVEPCFEGSSLEMFSMESFKNEFALMMDDIRNTFNLVKAFNEVDDKYPQEKSTEGGEAVLNKEENLSLSEEILEESNNYAEEPDLLGDDDKGDDDGEGDKGDSGSQGHDINGGSETTPTDQDPISQEPVIDDGDNDDDDNDDDEEVLPRKRLHEAEYILDSDLVPSLIRIIENAETVEYDGFSYPRYCYMDCDASESLVYFFDTEDDWKIYSCQYAINGDVISVDFETKKRMKIAIVEYIDGDSDDNEVIFTNNKAYKELEKKSKESIMSLEAELSELIEFKNNVERTAKDAAASDLFEQFADLANNEAFASLKENYSEFTLEQLEEKLYALRGRMNSKYFSLNENIAPKLPVVHSNTDENNSDEPYGGLFLEYANR